MKFGKIKDVKVIKLKKIKDHRGSVLQMIKKNSKYFKKFGEIYFSTLNKNKKKGMEQASKTIFKYFLYFRRGYNGFI